MSDTWPVRYDTTYYNWPAGYRTNVPTDALPSLSYSLSAGAITHTSYITYIVLSSPNPEDWVTVTYRTRTGTAVVPAVRHRDLITLTGFASSNIPFGVLTTTLVYTRQFPSGAPEDQWGNTVSQLI